MLSHSHHKLLNLIVIVVRRQQLPLRHVIRVEDHDGTVDVGARRCDDGDAMVRGMNAALDVYEGRPEIVGLDDVGSTTSTMN